MAIFNNGDNTSEVTNDSNTTIITAGAKIKGEINLSCNLYIDGELEGTINSSKEVNIGKNGHIKGTVITERLIVQGMVEGSVQGKTVEIKTGGYVKGEITSSQLIIESKGIFEGNSILKNTQSKKTQATIGKTKD